MIRLTVRAATVFILLAHVTLSAEYLYSTPLPDPFWLAFDLAVFAVLAAVTLLVCAPGPPRD